MALPIVIIIFFLIFLLLYGANMMVAGLRTLSRSTKTGVFALSAILLATATSLPELSVAVTSGLSGNSTLSLGNVLGANIANLTLVTGAATLLAGRVTVYGRLLHREIFLAGIAGVIPILFALDSNISRLDGLVLILLWGVYVIHFFKIRFTQIADTLAKEGFWHRFLHRVQAGEKAGAKLLLGIILLLVSSSFIVELSSVLARDAGISLFIVGALILAVGTTLPELAFSYKSLRAGEPTMFLGNILGSIITNSTLVVGVASFLSPINITPGVFGLVGMFIIIYIVFWFFVGREQHIGRREALALLIIYLFFVFIVGRQ